MEVCEIEIGTGLKCRSFLPLSNAAVAFQILNTAQQ